MTGPDDATTPGEPSRPGADAAPPSPHAARTRRASPDPFGDVLPDRTRDEQAAGWGEGPDDRDDDDERLRREVPPHHR